MCEVSHRKEKPYHPSTRTRVGPHGNEPGHQRRSSDWHRKGSVNTLLVRFDRCVVLDQWSRGVPSVRGELSKEDPGT